jgi:hypothetical protein
MLEHGVNKCERFRSGVLQGPSPQHERAALGDNLPEFGAAQTASGAERLDALGLAVRRKVVKDEFDVVHGGMNSQPGLFVVALVGIGRGRKTFPLGPVMENGVYLFGSF